MRIRRALAFAASVALLVAGCGGSQDGEEASDSNSSETDETNAADSAASGELGDVSFLYHTLEFEFMVGVEEGTRAAAEELEFNDYDVLGAQASSETQVRQFEDALASGVDGIVFSPNVSAELVPAVVSANEAGVPVITVDSIVADGDIAGSVTFDNVGGGAMAAQFISEEIGGSGKVLELTGPQGAFHAELRHEGFIDEMTDNHTDVTVETRDANFSAEESLSITTDVLTNDPDYDAIFVHTDGMLRGVLSALEQVEMTPGEGIIVVGLDGTPEALDLIREGSVLATVSADPLEIGREGAEMMARVLRGEEGETDIKTPPTLVTSENVDDQDLWGNQL